ncbi:class II aldolase/adducin family protein [Paraburkholderia sp. BCC1886]|uniref:class II aldolase/adducin family protein n=1 Tax=Paraburkholderia sp. BCC1886 TaxID=2562670 RepID=UPI001181FBFC|nr:class II aldolase/adducin family protein [Paraburkholderia sp. BCC1886]
MNSQAITQTPPVRSAAEQKTRIELASLYRLVAHFRMTDIIDTHISARVPETEHFLINRYGVMFHEMTPDDLVKIDLDGNPMEDGDPDSQYVNAAGFTIHSAVHSARHDLACVVHTHTADGIGVACQADGLLPITQHALRFYRRIAYHNYEGVALDLDERARLIADLGQHNAMILRNHGLLAGGRTIAEAFVNIHYLERACQSQIKAMSGGAKLTFPSPETCEYTAKQFEGPHAMDYCERVFTAAQRLCAA